MHPQRRTLLTLALAGLSSTARAQGVLVVSAAASLSDAFQEIGRGFEARHPGTVLRFNFAASGVLVQQILQGAPVDVLASADAQTLARGIDQKVLDARTRRDFASNTLVLVTPLHGAPAIRTWADLAGPAVRRIAMGKPATVPAGRHARELLERTGLHAAVASRIVYADHVRQVLDYVVRGEVDAGFVYGTDAAAHADAVRVVTGVEGLPPVRYPAAVTVDSRQPALARAFVEHLSSAEAQAVLARHGFGRP